MNYKKGRKFYHDTGYKKYKDICLIEQNSEHDFINDDIYAIIDDFFEDPLNDVKIDNVIEISKNQPFPISLSFIDLLIELLQSEQNIDQYISIIAEIIQYPDEYFINPLPISRIIQCLLHFTNISPEAISILTFFLKEAITLPEFDKIYSELNVIQNIEKQLQNNHQEIVIKSLIFFRYLLKTKLAFLPDNSIIYYKILPMAVFSANPINIFAIHTLYHFTKSYIKFHIKNRHKIRKEDRERHLLAKQLALPELFDALTQIEINGDTFLLYLLKIFQLNTRICRVFHYNSEQILKIVPILVSSLHKKNDKIVKLSLISIYNIMKDGRKKAYYALSQFNDEILNYIFQNYYNFSFNVQEEIIYVFIEYTYYLNADQLLHFFEEYNLIHILTEILYFDCFYLREDLFLGFLNIYDTFQKRGLIFLQHLNNEEFVDAVESMDPSCSTHFAEFYEKLMQLLTH